MNDDKDRILRLLEEKKITAEEAARLLDAVNKSDGGGAANRFLKVRVTERDGRPKVNITMPMGLVKWAIRMAPDSAKAKFNEQEIDMRAVQDALERGISGKIVDVEDEEKGQHVEVWLE